PAVKKSWLCAPLFGKASWPKLQCPHIVHPAAEPQTFDMPVFHRWLIELRDARSKPSSAGRQTDKEHGAAAPGRWRRHQHIVNPEVAVRRQRDTRNVRTELGEGRRGFTNQRREHTGVAVRANRIGSAQQQASAVDADTPVDLHVRCEIGNHPDLTGRVDAADNVPNHVREAAVRVGGTRHVRYRNITDGSLESHQRIIGYYRRSKDPPMRTIRIDEIKLFIITSPSFPFLYIS